MKSSRVAFVYKFCVAHEKRGKKRGGQSAVIRKNSIFKCAKSEERSKRQNKNTRKNKNIHTVVWSSSSPTWSIHSQTCAAPRLCASKSFIVIHHDRDRDGIKYNLVYCWSAAAAASASSCFVVLCEHGLGLQSRRKKARKSEVESKKDRPREKSEVVPTQ